MKTYDSKNVSVIVGTHVVTGLADGEAVKVERNEDSFSVQVGAQGEVTRTKNNNRTGKITITTQQLSDSNKVLQGLLAQDEESGTGFVPCLIRDNSNNALHTVENGWIMRQPNSSYGQEATNVEWVIECEDIRSVL